MLVIPGCYIVRRQPSAEPPLPWYLTDEDTSIVHRACQDLLLPTHLSEMYSERFACLGTVPFRRVCGTNSWKNKSNYPQNFPRRNKGMVCQCLPSRGEQTRFDTEAALNASWMCHSIRVVMKIPPPPVLLTPIITQGERPLLTTLCAVYLTDEDAHHRQCPQSVPRFYQSSVQPASQGLVEAASSVGQRTATAKQSSEPGCQVSVKREKHRDCESDVTAHESGW